MFILLGLVGMELLAYVVHRFLFHGILWKIHRTHHESHQHTFESNDIFSLLFAAMSIALMFMGDFSLHHPFFGIGLGISIYGILYFVIHDLFTHRRFLPFSTQNKILNTIKRAHQRHHQTIEKIGFEPYGLFLFPYHLFKNGFRRKK